MQVTRDVLPVYIFRVLAIKSDRAMLGSRTYTLCSLSYAPSDIGMSRDDNDNLDPMLEGEGPPQARSTPAKPVVDETWTQVEALPTDDDSDYTDEEVSQT